MRSLKMKKAFIILIPFLFSVLLYSSVLAIDRVPRKGDSTSGERKEEVKSEPSAKAKVEGAQSQKEEPKKETREKIDLKKPEKKEEKGIFNIFRKQKPSQKKEIKERYDYFIDKNGDGIDDRLEKKKTEERENEKAEKSKTSSQGNKGRTRR
jgi:hypothetical protein